MCGICGIVNTKGTEVKELSLRTMMHKMKHRGPDDEGVFTKKNIGLGFVRLSIIDLTQAGHQPFRSDDGRYIIVFNGEIFNYIELREELISLGYSFRTKTDTEVLMKAFMEWDKDCLHKFNGMWAFTIFDQLKNRMFIARDRYGIKPFYYSFSGERFLFASEIPPILEEINQKPKPNYQSIFDYLVFNKTEQREETFFEGIYKLMHGHLIDIDLNTIETFKQVLPQKWYDIHQQVKKVKGFNSSEDYKKVFQDAVKFRMRSDVPVGVCFSGGLDSSAIVSVIIDELKKKNLNTFSAVYDSSFSRDESYFINLYKNKPGQRHYTTPSSNGLLDDLDRFIECHAEPIPSTSPYAQYKVMELAKENVVVTIDGQGADEQLAGYHYFFGFYYKDLLKNFRLWRLFKEIWYYLRIHRSTFALKTFAFFLLPKSLKTKARVFGLGYFNPVFIKKFSNNNLISDDLYGSKSLQDSLINHFEYKLEHLLKWEDRNSMFFSLEARVPFLDFNLVEKSLATTSELIINNGMTKYIFRESMKGILPEEIRLRVDKNGFLTPENEWFRTSEWQNKIWDIIRSKEFASRGLFNVKKIHELYQNHIDKKASISREIWKWIHIELWFRKFID